MMIHADPFGPQVMKPDRLCTQNIQAKCGELTAVDESRQQPFLLGARGHLFLDATWPRWRHWMSGLGTSGLTAQGEP